MANKLKGYKIPKLTPSTPRERKAVIIKRLFGSGAVRVPTPVSNPTKPPKTPKVTQSHKLNSPFPLKELKVKLVRLPELPLNTKIPLIKLSPPNPTKVTIQNKITPKILNPSKSKFDNLFKKPLKLKRHKISPVFGYNSLVKITKIPSNKTSDTYTPLSSNHLNKPELSTALPISEIPLPESNPPIIISEPKPQITLPEPKTSIPDVNLTINKTADPPKKTLSTPRSSFFDKNKKVPFTLFIPPTTYEEWNNRAAPELGWHWAFYNNTWNPVFIEPPLPGCYNCGGFHHYQYCNEQQKHLFCPKCGLRNITRLNCPKHFPRYF